MSRIHNFSAGPAVLPESVLHAAQAALWDHAGTGVGVLECSHRSKPFQAVVDDAMARMRRLLRLDDDQEILFLQGGASTQFYMVPMNLLRGGTAAYLDTGRWSSLAAKEAHRFGTVITPFSSAAGKYDRVPRPGEAEVPAGTTYLHYTSNNTVAGTEYDHQPVPPVGTLLVCDASSDILSRELDGSRFDLLYAGAQKNLGPAGVTVVIVRRSLLERCDPDLPTMLRYQTHVDKGSMHNTPCTFGIFVVREVLRWIEDQGGLSVVEAANKARADRLYAAIDASSLFRGLAEPASRSRMNVTFTTGSAELDTTFHTRATEAGLSGLKGHKSVGGLRASLYNAQTDAAVDALIVYMAAFEAEHA
jgi:phosphoserine aminotransferase